MRFYSFISLFFLAQCLLAGNFKGFFSLETRYDSNIARLATKELDEFNTLSMPEKKFGIKRVDDIIYIPSTEIIYRWGLSNYRLSHKINLKYCAYQNTHKKNYFSFEFSTSIAKFDDAVFIIYLIEPLIYDRKYFDPDSGKQEWAGYRKDRFSLGFKHEFNRKLKLNLLFSNELRNYLNTFIEYSSTKPEFSIKFDVDFVPIISQIGFRYGFLLAKAYDSKNETKANSDEPDISRKEYSLSLSLVLGNISLFKLSSSLAYTVHQYTSEKDELVDPIHKGRKDRIFLITFALSTQRVKRTSLALKLNHTFRISYSPYYSRIEDLKNYNKTVVSLIVNHALR